MELNFFLTLKLKSFNSISSLFGKTVKRPINYFSQTFTQISPRAKVDFWVPNQKKIKKNHVLHYAKMAILLSKTSNTFFQQLGKIRVSYYLDIGNFFYQKKITVQQPNLRKLFLDLKFFPDFEAQIVQQHFLIIWQDGQTPYQLFFHKHLPKYPHRQKFVPYFCCIWANDPL